MKKINLKMMIIAVITVFLAINLNLKYNEHKELLENKKMLLENKEKFEKKIIEIETEKSLEKEKNIADYDKIIMLTKRLSFFSIKNESEFKKMIYIFAHESDLKMKEISKAENVWEKNGYKLKYIHFTTFGSLNDFGKFLYLINKSKRYIDTSRLFIELTSHEFKISIGFIEKKL